MKEDTLPGTENMKCAIGLYYGTRRYVEGEFKGHSVTGVFSYVDVSDDGPCNRPVRVWCKWKDGNNAWLACANPNHQRDAEIVLLLNEEYIAYLVWQQNPFAPMPEILRNRTKRNPFLDAPKKVITVGDETKALPAKKRIPRNKGNKAARKARTLGEALQAIPPQNRAEAYREAAKTGLRILVGVAALGAKADKGKL
jgi:hypothetical protein